MAGVQDNSEHSAAERWVSSLSPRKRSCFGYRNLEPCVNKAIQNLLILKQDLRLVTLKQSSTVEFLTDVQSPSTSHDNADNVTVKGTAAPSLSDLHISQHISRSEHEKYYDFIEGALFLILRLDKDTVETKLKLETVKEKVISLRKTLDVEAVRRMVLLKAAVQEEHEACMRDLQELKWHVSYEGRNLKRRKDKVTTTAEKNEELKKKVKYLNDQIPFLKDKLVRETEEIESIKEEQIQADVELKAGKAELVNSEDNLKKTIDATDMEKNQLTAKLDASQREVNLANEKLSNILVSHAELVHKINLARSSVTKSQKELSAQSDRQQTLHDQYSFHNKDVEELLQQMKNLEKSNYYLSQSNETRKSQMGIQRRDLESEHSVLMDNMQLEHKQLKNVRDKIEEIQQELDSMRQSIAKCMKQSQDSIKSVERAKLELVKLDKQLQVSLDEYGKVRERNHHLDNKMQLEKAVSGEAEQSLKNQVSAIRSQVQEESRAKTSYMTQIALEKKDLNTLRTVGKSKLEKQTQLAKEANTQNDDDKMELQKVEKDCNERKKHCELLEEELKNLKEECSTTEHNLSTQVAELQPQSEQLKVEVEDKQRELKKVIERLQQLINRTEDCDKSLKVLERKEHDINGKIEALEKELGELQEKINEGRQVEETLKEELQQLREFSANVEVKYEAYMKERTEYLERNKDELATAFEDNDSLVIEYQRIQQCFMKEKTAALKVIERKLELETSLRDHVQLLSLQSEQHKVLEEYYNHRGLAGRRCLTALHQRSHVNSHQIKKLTDKFEVAIKQMQRFLDTTNTSLKKHGTATRKVHFNSQVMCSPAN